MKHGEAERSLCLRLASLRREIAAAESRLSALVSLLEEGGSHDWPSLESALRENEELREANRVAGQETESAFAALDLAVRASQTDALTGLRNRASLWSRLEHDLELARRNGTFVAVYFFDIDKFKSVNDELGHAAGDLVLQHVAGQLSSAVRTSDTVCRFGGDEFVVICQAARAEDLSVAADKLSSALETPVFIADRALDCSVSMGASLYSGEADTAVALVQRADEAMYSAKRQRIATGSHA